MDNIFSFNIALYPRDFILFIPKSFIVFSSVQLEPTLCDPTDCSMPGFPVHHQLREFTQIHVH